MNEAKKKKPSIKRFFKWMGIAFLLLIIGLIIVATIFEKQIGALVIKTLNKQLKTELKVEDATLSLIRQFPKAAVYLNNVELKGVGSQEEKLLVVESIALKCSIWGLLTGHYDFKSISIDNGHVFIYSDRKGKTNYDVLNTSDEPEEEDSEGGDLNLSISNFTLNNLMIHYVEEQAKHDFKILAKSAYFEGDFMIDNKQNMENYSILSYADLYSEHITLDETTYLTGKKLSYDGSVVLDNANGIYTFNKIELYLEENGFTVDGSIENKEKGTQYNLVFGSDNARLNSLLHLLPSQYLTTLGGLESHADLHFDARVNGLYTKSTNPIIEVNFGLKEGRLTHPKLIGSMKNVKFDVAFTNGNGRDDKTAKLELKDFEAILNNEPINMHYLMTGLQNPIIDMSFDGKIPIAAIYQFLGENLTDGTGSIHIEEFNLKGKLKDMTSMARIPNVSMTGIVNLDQIGVTINEITSYLETGKLTLRDNIFNVADLLITMPNNHILLNGNFENALPVLLSDSINSKNAQLIFKASLQSNKMDIDEMIAFSAGHTEEEIQEAPVEQQDSLIRENQVEREHFTSFLNGTFQTNIATLKYDKVLAKNFKGKVAFENSIMNLQEVGVDAMEGHFELNSRVHFEKEPYIEAFLDCNNIDIQQFFAQLDNFGQEVMTSENIHGRLESLIKMNVFFDSLGNLKQDKLYVVADVNLTNGELVDFEMLTSFSSVIKLKDLQTIRFTNLKNQFKIENETMYIPAMFIQSNAINLVLGGQYSFNHDMDFKIKINAGQIVANKFKRFNPGREPLKARQKGLFNIYAHIYGNLYDDYQYKLGPKNTKKALEAELNKKLPAITNILKAEFAKAGAEESLQQKIKEIAPPAAWEDIPEYESGSTSGEEYIDGF